MVKDGLPYSDFSNGLGFPCRVIIEVFRDKETAQDVLMMVVLSLTPFAAVATNKSVQFGC